jgi:hypothetical protein
LGFSAAAFCLNLQLEFAFLLMAFLLQVRKRRGKKPKGYSPHDSSQNARAHETKLAARDSPWHYVVGVRALSNERLEIALAMTR